MTSSKFLVTSAVVLLVAVVAVLGAPSNSTSSSTSVSPGVSRRTTTTVQPGSSTTKRRTTTAKTTTVQGQGSPNSTSTRKPTNSQSAHVRPVRDTHADSAPGVQTVHPPTGVKVNGNIGFKSNSSSSRPARSNPDDTEEVANEKTSEDAPSTSHSFVPSNHPLFTNRASSNVTDSLRPKLRTPVVKASGDDSAESQDNHGQSNDGDHQEPAIHTKATSQEESVSSVVSTAPVGVSGRNSSAVKGFGNRRAPPKKQAEDEDLLL